ncbi:hypothetical protein ACFWZT_18750 [Streptomyces alboflavus]|uniref:hypothetical protein n=1 Tax=Streptomyces alboflavus TaxID=67267 RepID=UPI00369F6C57
MAVTILAGPAQASPKREATKQSEQTKEPAKARGIGECTMYLELKGYEITDARFFGCFSGKGLGGAHGIAVCTGTLLAAEVRLRHAAPACALSIL